MGFCDCAPNDPKELQVLFLFKKVPHMAVISDQVCKVSPQCIVCFLVFQNFVTGVHEYLLLK